MIENHRTERVLLADDHPLFRAGVRQVIEASRRYEIVAEVGDGYAAVQAVTELKPDFALLDLSMPGMNGFEVLEHLKATALPTRFLIISMYAEHSYAERARDLGAAGYFAKEDAISEMLQALQLPDDKFFTSQSVGGNSLTPPVANTSPVSLLTPAERRVLLLVGTGQTSKEIARQLDISPRTVDAHRRNCAEKLEITGRNKLIEFAVVHREQLSID